jgi:hypothetical protein
MSNRLENDVERSCHGPIEVLSRYFPGATEETHETAQDNRCPDRHSNRAPLECKPRALLLQQSGNTDERSFCFSLIVEAFPAANGTRRFINVTIVVV